MGIIWGLQLLLSIYMAVKIKSKPTRAKSLCYGFFIGSTIICGIILTLSQKLKNNKIAIEIFPLVFLVFNTISVVLYDVFAHGDKNVNPTTVFEKFSIIIWFITLMFFRNNWLFMQVFSITILIIIFSVFCFKNYYDKEDINKTWSFVGI